MILNLLSIAKVAGDAIIKVYNSDFSMELKKDCSPLTEADKKSHEIIISGLADINRNIPIISEEGKETGFEIRKNWHTFWLIDPLDGTKEFIKKNGEFTVNIALIENRKPIIGIIYIPVQNVFYYASIGNGAYKKNGEFEPVKITVDKKINSEKIKVVVSRSHPSQELEEYLKQFENIEKVVYGSSLKFCKVAEGTAHIYPRFGPTHEWDTAAGHCIAEEAGAKVTLTDNSQLYYNKKNLINENFIVSSL